MHVGRFAARRFDQFEKHVRRVPWSELLPAGAGVRASAHCRRSRLYHTGAIAQRLVAFIDAPAEGDPVVEVRVRFDRDVCTLSLVTTGAPLTQRGYRLEASKAPLREDLARALLRLAGWPGIGGALVDPMCGAGTLLIEGALLAEGRAPGLGRRFACETFPFVDAAAFAEARGAAEAATQPAAGRIIGGDRDDGAVGVARRNAARAAVTVEVDRAPLSSLSRRVEALGHSAGGGLVATNPPHGGRVSARRDLRPLHQALGREVRALGDGWRLALVVTDPQLARLTGLRMTQRLVTDHGGRKIHLLTSD
jgi:putative N6-adenine-specific DNA methylase